MWEHCVTWADRLTRWRVQSGGSMGDDLAVALEAVERPRVLVVIAAALYERADALCHRTYQVLEATPAVVNAGRAERHELLRRARSGHPDSRARTVVADNAVDAPSGDDAPYWQHTITLADRRPALPPPQPGRPFDITAHLLGDRATKLV